MKKNQLIIKQYEEVCQLSNIDMITSGRYILSGFNYTAYLAADIAKKLKLNKNDKLIDVGCNIGIYHKYLHKLVRNIFGIDAGAAIIKKAKKNNKYNNVDYACFNVLEDNWSNFKQRFNKALVYSVIHFFNNKEDLKRLLSGLLKILTDDFIILLGEVRDKTMYENFKNNQKYNKTSLRDIKFFFNKLFNTIYLSKVHRHNLTTTSFSEKEIIGICDSLGIKAHLIKQDKKHPFYNTCVDYVLTKKTANL